MYTFLGQINENYKKDLFSTYSTPLEEKNTKKHVGSYSSIILCVHQQVFSKLRINGHSFTIVQVLVGNIYKKCYPCLARPLSVGLIAFSITCQRVLGQAPEKINFHFLIIVKDFIYP